MTVLQTTFLEARAGLWRVSGKRLGTGTRGQKSFVSSSPCTGVLEFWIPALSLTGGHCCQFTDPRAERRAKCLWFSVVEEVLMAP